MEIGETYWRISKDGHDRSMIVINNQKEKEYHKSLQKKGFKYTLQQVSPSATCTSCEG